MRARVFVALALAALPLSATATLAEQGQNIRFRGMDRNGDGRITRAEWRGSAQSFRNHDWNGDGVLSGDEVRPNGRADDPQDQTRPEFDDWTTEGFSYLDRNRDGRIARAEWFDDRASFIRADRNGDGILTRAEFLAMGSGGYESPRDERFETMDTNNNGRVERREWTGSANRFDTLDTNNDNILTRGEFLATADADTPREERFESMDSNNNGRVERREWTGSANRFDTLDLNNDNILTRAEFFATTDPDSPREERFETMDSNNNGRIERREWTGSAIRFDTLDVNNDNVITRAEMLGNADDAESRMFTDADANRDYRLSESEWRWTRRAFLQQDANRDGWVSREEFSTPTGTVGTFGQSDTQPVVVNVSSTARWVDTGIDIRQGDVLRITSTGTVRLSGNWSDSASPGGANRHAANAPLPYHPAGALIARISNGTPFFIGDGTNVDRVNMSGRLYLSVNDDHLNDNSGSFRVTISVRAQ